MPLRYLLILGAIASASFAEAEELTVVSYNMKHGRGVDGVVDLSRQAALLASLDADIIALQEVDLANRRTGFEDQTARLAEMISEGTGARWRHLDAPAIAYEGGFYGNGVLFNDDLLDVVDHWILALPGSRRGDGARSAGITWFRFEDDRKILFATTHLTQKNKVKKDGSTFQIDSIEKIDAAMEIGLPSIIAGDFNASVHADDARNIDTMMTLDSMGWRVDSPVDGSTTSTDGPIVVDHIVSRNTDGWEVVDSYIATFEPAAMASDHFPVVVTYRLPD